MRPVVVSLLVGLVLLGAAPAADAAERLCDEQLVTMSDGVRLHAWVSRLAPDERRPVLFMMDSYSRSGTPGEGPSSDNACPNTLPDDYVPAFLSAELTEKFTLVQVAYRGTGSSEGLFDLTGARTQTDVREAIAWAAGLPQSNGDVVLVGESGTGFVAHHGLTEPAVRAALIYTSCADMYRCFYRGGTYNGLAGVYAAATLGGYAAGAPGRVRLGAMATDPVSQMAALDTAFARTLSESTYTGFWRERSALERLPRTRVPVLFTTDLYDIVQPWDALQLTPGARLSTGMGHLAPPLAAAGGDRYRAGVRRQADRFLARYGLREKNGAERDARITVVMNTGSMSAYRAAQVYARGESRWPLPSTRWTTLRLGPGTLSDRAPRSTAPQDVRVAPLPRGDLRTNAMLQGDGVETDMRDEESGGLTFTTPVLKRDLEVTGPITLRLWATADVRDFDWAVRLTDVQPGGASEWISDGYLRASLRRVDRARSQRVGRRVVRPWHSYDTPEAVPAGEPVLYEIEILPTSNVWRRGHALRVSLVPGGGGGLDSARTGGAGTASVLTDTQHPSSLLLPVIPSRCQKGKPLSASAPKLRCAKSYASAAGR